MLIDLAINPFGAEVAAMAALAVAAEDRGFGAIWVADHFSGAVAGQPWSRDPFVCLAAIAVRTRVIALGPLVANMNNRHPAQLAAAVNSLQSLAPGRVRLGIGSGAAPGSRFAVEHEAIGTDLGTVEHRRTKLDDSIRSLHALWAGEETFAAPTGVGFDGLVGVIDGAPRPPIIVGASGWPTIELALGSADGVNLRRTARVAEHVDSIMSMRRSGFEVSVLDGFADVVEDPSRLDDAVDMGLDRLVLGISVPHDVERLDGLDVSRFHGG